MTSGLRMARLVDRLLAAVLIVLIAAYQMILSPFLIGGCRHIPSCSQYATEALRRHGTGRGLRLILTRLARCRPRGTFGWDPVP